MTFLTSKKRVRYTRDLRVSGFHEDDTVFYFPPISQTWDIGIQSILGYHRKPPQEQMLLLAFSRMRHSRVMSRKIISESDRFLSVVFETLGGQRTQLENRTSKMTHHPLSVRLTWLSVYHYVDTYKS